MKIIRPSVVLTKGNKILLLRSKYSSGEFFLLPGGGIEGNESVEETAVRETKEETNYDISIKKLLYLTEWIDEKRGKDVLYVIFLGKIKGGDETHLKDPVLHEGHIKGIEWIDVKNLHKIKFYPKEIISHLKKDCLKRFKSSPVPYYNNGKAILSKTW